MAEFVENREAGGRERDRSRCPGERHGERARARSGNRKPAFLGGEAGKAGKTVGVHQGRSSPFARLTSRGRKVSRSVRRRKCRFVNGAGPTGSAAGLLLARATALPLLAGEFPQRLFAAADDRLTVSQQ